MEVRSTVKTLAEEVTDATKSLSRKIRDEFRDYRKDTFNSDVTGNNRVE
ncbi:hypothetical protein [Vibrio phage vB_VmeM-Yong XC32]|nr:hypothetical protein [Vibrio phage vB_VmeM-Yong XC31]QAX96445.1 hypothetical protein [Vibrio phage vB_VmeM-Yong XC32]QAX96762.1 hypothetical protein [Vibrio phage vB_VmeM-Yong MS31]QAX97081.1 hypothetical protein [Vibrio phage vB_VmeM-Yong MS32]